LVGTIHNVLVMEIGWTDVGSGGYILVKALNCLLHFMSLLCFHIKSALFCLLQIKGQLL